MSAGGTFALYSLLCRHAKFSLLPNYQAVDEELSKYQNPCQSTAIAPSQLKRYLDKNKNFRTILLVVVLYGACMVMCIGILNPPISVLSSLDGLQLRVEQLSHRTVVGVACAVLVGQFALQHRGTYRVAFIFPPVVLVWLLSIAGIGVYNVIHWNPRIYRAFSPHYIYLYFQQTGKEGWLSLGNVFLAITGTEVMFADLGNFTAASLRVAFICFVYPCLVLQYLGQAAFISKNFYAVPASFYASIPELMFWPVFIMASLAAIVASQSVISGAFSIVKQCQALGCLPRVKVVRKLRWIHGHVYVPEINWILMVSSLAVTFGFRSTTLIGNAYGLVSIIVTLVNTWLITLVIIFVWNQSWNLALLFLLFFGSIEFVYLSSSLMKIAKGGWVPAMVSMILFSIMYVWHYGGRLRYMYDVQNKVSMKWILSLGPSLGIVRIPGIGIIFSELVNGIPPMFSLFISNLPAFYHIAVFVCVKYVPVPYVSDRERYLIGRIGPKKYRMYRCIVRYGYKDVPAQDEDFEDNIVTSVNCRSPSVVLNIPQICLIEVGMNYYL
uniref:Potassium transporter n=1 Tax=Kalanchoe fedtschenkoi TaxID=63787 RepID=A0A7N0R9M1_KALFE